MLIQELIELRKTVVGLSISIDQAFRNYDTLVNDYNHDELATYQIHETIGLNDTIADENDIRLYLDFVLNENGLTSLKYTIQNYSPIQDFHIIDGYGHLQPATNKDVVYLIDLAIEYLLKD